MGSNQAPQQPEKIMNLSIQQILVIRQRNFNVLNRAFSESIGENYMSPDYSLTKDDANKVFSAIDRIEQEARQDNDIFPRTIDQKWADVREANEAAEAFRDLVYNIFKL